MKKKPYMILVQKVYMWKQLYTFDHFLADICVMDALIAKFSMALYVTKGENLRDLTYGCD